MEANQSHNAKTNHPTCLTIAGSDCSGAAGIQADLKVMTAHQVYGMSVLTALTCQNSHGITGIYPLHPSLIQRQIDACLSDIQCRVVKIGMLPDPKSIPVISQALTKYKITDVVMDSVIISSMGNVMCETPTIPATIQHLFPHLLVYASNVMEAFILVEKTLKKSPPPLKSFPDIQNLMSIIHRLGPKFVVLRGHHVAFDKNMMITEKPDSKSWTADLIYDGKEFYIFEKPYNTTKSIHGESCSLTAAIASNLACNIPPLQAIHEALYSIEWAIQRVHKKSSDPYKSAQLFTALGHSSKFSGSLISLKSEHYIPQADLTSVLLSHIPS